jgi:very-short-patch-repair endonuclease
VGFGAFFEKGIDFMPLDKKAFARKLRTRETGAEELLWEQLRNRRLDGWKFRRQVRIAGYIADFGCYDAGITIEIDGKQHAEHKTDDAARRAAIERHGYLEIRFTNEEINERLDWVMQEILRALDVARARGMREAHPRIDGK